MLAGSQLILGHFPNSSNTYGPHAIVSAVVWAGAGQHTTDRKYARLCHTLPGFPGVVWGESHESHTTWGMGRPTSNGS
jgi:hypothetical protein